MIRLVLRTLQTLNVLKCSSQSMAVLGTAKHGTEDLVS